MQEAYAIAEQVARGDTTSVLIEGESGTGKEYFANLIHRMSARHDKPFVEINCAAIPSELLESELFGHEKGAFTDARAQKLGLMELANGGTLFLDEIGEMSPMLQVKLLRVLERRTFKRVGGTKDITVNVRIISATNQDLERMVQEGTFREDLYYRLKVVPLYVPPLRERREDILPLSRLFMDRFARAVQEAVPGASRRRPSACCSTTRGRATSASCKNLFERTVLLETGPTCSRPAPQARAARARRRPRRTLGQRVDDVLTGALPTAGIPFEALVEELERALILRASYATKWNQSRTAELLHLKRDKLRYRMKLYELHPDGRRGDERRGPRSQAADTRARPRTAARPIGLAVVLPARRGRAPTRASTGAAARAPQDHRDPGVRERHHRVHAGAGHHRRGDRALRRRQPPASVVDERSADCGAARARSPTYQNSVFGISDADRAQEYRVTIGVAVAFKDQVKNREIWSDDDLVQDRELLRAGRSRAARQDRARRSQGSHREDRR